MFYLEIIINRHTCLRYSTVRTEQTQLNLRGLACAKSNQVYHPSKGMHVLFTDRLLGSERKRTGGEFATTRSPPFTISL